MRNKKVYMLVAFLMPLAGLVGCSSDSGGSGKSGSRTIGIVSAVNGSNVNVGGKTFDASGASVKGDGTSSVSDLQRGMKVSVTSSGDMDADEIDYDAEVEGVVTDIDVSGNSGTLVVMGQTVTVNDQTQFVSEVSGVTSIDMIPLNSVVEVSGYSDGMGSITATFIKLEDDTADENDDMEVEGVVSNLDTGAMTFEINGFMIQYDENTEGADLLADGVNVEVDIYMNSSGEFIADEIEIEDEDINGDEGDEIEIEGMVTSDGVVDGMFAVNGEMVKLGDNVKYEGGSEADIVNGAYIEVEGELDSNGMLIVHEVEFDDGMDDSDDMMTPMP